MQLFKLVSSIALCVSTAFATFPNSTLPIPSNSSDIAASWQDTASPSGTYCSTVDQLYGASAYTYAEFQICLEVTPSKDSVILVLSAVQYKWGGAWYNPSPKYPAKWTISGSVGDDTFSQSGTTPGPSGSYNVGSISKLTPGLQTVAGRYYQVGPYWEADAAIDYPFSKSIFIPSGTDDFLEQDSEE